MSKEKKELQFFYNGVKVLGNKSLLSAGISFGSRFNSDEKVLTIYAKKETVFNDEVFTKNFKIKNDTDYETNYYENDRFDIPKESIYFKDCLEAYLMNLNRTKRRYEQKIKACVLNSSELVYYTSAHSNLLLEIDNVRGILRNV